MTATTTELDCGSTLDIASVAEFHAQCLEALKDGQNVMIKADELERTDTAALQVMAAFFQDAKLQQQTLEWQSPSEALCRSAALLGLTELLQLQHSGD